MVTGFEATMPETLRKSHINDNFSYAKSRDSLIRGCLSVIVQNLKGTLKLYTPPVTSGGIRHPQWPEANPPALLQLQQQR